MAQTDSSSSRSKVPLTGNGQLLHAASFSATTGFHEFLKEQLDARWRKYRTALKRCRKKYNEDSIHELRIETRRMLALLELLHPFHPGCLQKFEKRYKKAFKSSADLRDTQVQLAAVAKAQKEYPELAAFKKFLRCREKRLAKRFWKKIEDSPKPKLKKGLKSLREWLTAWSKNDATDDRHGQVLLNRLDAARERALRLRQSVQAAAPETIHRFRIAFKAYRYMLETLQPLLLGLSDAHIEALHSYQTRMGQIQDTEVLLAMLQEFAKFGPEFELPAFQAEVEQRRRKLIAEFLAIKFPE